MRQWSAIWRSAQASGERAQLGGGDRERWDTLDATLVRLRSCRSMSELAECAGEFAVQGCGAEAAAIGQVTGGVWTPWLRSSDLTRLEPAGAVPSAPFSVDEAPGLELLVIRTGRSGVRELPETAAGGRVAVAAIVGRDAILGLLHVVAPDLRVEIVESYAGALGSMMALLGVRRRAGEQRYTCRPARPVERWWST